MNNIQLQKFAIGLALVIICVKILKKILRHPRPIMTDRDTYGMPSTRAASLFFIIIYLLLNHKNVSKTTIIILFTTAIFCCGIKYFMKEHLLSQLCAGAIVGSILAYLVTIF